VLHNQKKFSYVFGIYYRANLLQYLFQLGIFVAQEIDLKVGRTKFSCRQYIPINLLKKIVAVQILHTLFWQSAQFFGVKDLKNQIHIKYLETNHKNNQPFQRLVKKCLALHDDQIDMIQCKTYPYLGTLF
jgi:hypothetical protein